MPESSDCTVRAALPTAKGHEIVPEQLPAPASAPITGSPVFLPFAFAGR